MLGENFPTRKVFPDLYWYGHKNLNLTLLSVNHLQVVKMSKARVNRTLSRIRDNPGSFQIFCPEQ